MADAGLAAVGIEDHTGEVAGGRRTEVEVGCSRELDPAFAAAQVDDDAVAPNRGVGARFERGIDQLIDPGPQADRGAAADVDAATIDPGLSCTMDPGKVPAVSSQCIGGQRLGVGTAASGSARREQPVSGTGDRRPTPFTPPCAQIALALIDALGRAWIASLSFELA